MIRRMLGIRTLSSFILFLYLFSTSIQAQDLTFSTIQGSSNALLAERIVREAYERIGVQISVKRYPAARALTLANRGVSDGELQRVENINLEYTNLVRIPTPLFPLEGIIITKNIDLPISGRESLRPYLIGIINGVRFAEKLTKGFQTIKVTNGAQLIEMLHKDRIDVAIIGRFSAMKYIQDSEFLGLKLIEPPIVSINLYHYLHQKHRDLVPKIKESLNSLHKDGSIRKMIDEHIEALQKDQ